MALWGLVNERLREIRLEKEKQAQPPKYKIGKRIICLDSDKIVGRLTPKDYYVVIGVIEVCEFASVVPINGGWIASEYDWLYTVKDYKGKLHYVREALIIRQVIK